MFGRIEIAPQTGLKAMPQKAQSAWDAAMNGFVGASYKPLVFAGTQFAKGTNYWYIAEQTLITYPQRRALVVLAINEFMNEYSIVQNSIEEIF